MTEIDLFKNFKNIMPGDFLTDDIEVKNTTDLPVKIYLRANPYNDKTNPLSPEVAEHETIASMNDYLSKLSLRVYNDGNLIYSASPDQANTLSDYVLLGEFDSGELTILHVELSAPLDLDDEYAHRFGEVSWTFLTEEIPAIPVPNTGLFANLPSFLAPSLLILLPLIIFVVLKSSILRKH